MEGKGIKLRYYCHWHALITGLWLARPSICQLYCYVSLNYCMIAVDIIDFYKILARSEQRWRIRDLS